MKKSTCFKKASDIKAGIIGYGPSFGMGKLHLDQMAAAGMSICAMADIDPERCEACAAEFPSLETYTSTTEMLEHSEVDLIAIITPHNTHAELAIQCMKAGRHVITEKPFAINTDECDALIEARDSNQVMLSVHHNRHWDGLIIKAREKIESGIIGKILHLDAHLGEYRMPGEWWRGSKSISGGLMFDWGAHFIEYALQLLPGKIMEVSGFMHNGFWAAQSSWKEDCIEDEAFSLVRFDDGTYLKLKLSSLETNPKPSWLEVNGSKGSFIIQPNSWTAHCQEQGGEVLRQGPIGDSQRHLFYDNIVAHLLGKAELSITAEYARRIIHIIDWTARSSKANRALPVRYN